MCISFPEMGLFLARLKVLFILIFFPFLLFQLDFLLHPLPRFCCSHQPSLHPRKGRACFRVKGKGQCCLVQVASHRGVWVTKAVVWLPGRLCFPGKAFPGLLTQLSLCSLMEMPGADGLGAPLNPSEAATRGTLSQWLHSAFTSVVQEVFFLFLLFFFFLSFSFFPFFYSLCVCFFKAYVATSTFLATIDGFIPLIALPCWNTQCRVPQHSSAFVCKAECLAQRNVSACLHSPLGLPCYCKALQS